MKRLSLLLLLLILNLFIIKKVDFHSQSENNLVQVPEENASPLPSLIPGRATSSSL